MTENDPELDEQGSPEAERLVAEYQAFQEHLARKYGPRHGELGPDDVKIMFGLNARGAKLPPAELRYVCKRLGIDLDLAKFIFRERPRATSKEKARKAAQARWAKALGKNAPSKQRRDRNTWE